MIYSPFHRTIIRNVSHWEWSGLIEAMTALKWRNEAKIYSSFWIIEQVPFDFFIALMATTDRRNLWHPGERAKVSTISETIDRMLRVIFGWKQFSMEWHSQISMSCTPYYPSSFVIFIFLCISIKGRILHRFWNVWVLLLTMSVRFVQGIDIQFLASSWLLLNGRHYFAEKFQYTLKLECNSNPDAAKHEET